MINPFITLYVASQNLSERLQALKENEKGASAVEYAILVGVLAAVVVAAVGLLGGRITALFNGIAL